MKTKKVILLVIVSLAILNLSHVALAGEILGEPQLLCLKKDEVVEFSKCSSSMKDVVCKANFCQYCVSKKQIDETDFSYCPRSLSSCYEIGYKCELKNGSFIVTQEEPFYLNVFSPIQNFSYPKAEIILNLSTNKKSEIYFVINEKFGNSWKKLCDNCSFFKGKLDFYEGLNNLTFRAKDSKNKTIYREVLFYVDSIDPKINRVNPTKGYANGVFEIEFEEENTNLISLFYGNETKMDLKRLDLRRDCQFVEKKTVCSSFVNLSNFTNQKIEYFFEIEDFAGRKSVSKKNKLLVDSIKPHIKNVSYKIRDYLVEVELSIIEENFQIANYYNHKDTKKRKKTFCQSLDKNGKCRGLIKLVQGENIIDFEIIDKAGNNQTTTLRIIAETRNTKK